jgi:hypothetical protein
MARDQVNNMASATSSMATRRDVPHSPRSDFGPFQFELALALQESLDKNRQNLGSTVTNTLTPNLATVQMLYW